MGITTKLMHVHGAVGVHGNLFLHVVEVLGTDGRNNGFFKRLSVLLLEKQTAKAPDIYGGKTYFIRSIIDCIN